MPPPTQFKNNVNTGTLHPVYEAARAAGLNAETTGKGTLKALHALVLGSSSEADADEFCGFTKTGAPVQPAGLTGPALATWISIYQGKNFDMDALVSDPFGKKLKTLP